MAKQNVGQRAVRWTVSGLNKWRLTFSVTIVMVFSVLRGVPPQLVEWPYAHWLINYDFGFVKRGFVGEVAQRLGFALDPMHAGQTLIPLVWGIFIVLMVLLLWVSLRIWQRTQQATLTAMLVVLFFASGFIVMTSNLMGYYDHIWQIGTIITLWLIVQRRLLMAAFLQIIWVLVHESYLLVGYPVVVFALVLVWMQDRSHFQHRRRVGLMLALVVPLITFAVVFLMHDLQDTALLSQQLLDHLGRYDDLSERFTPFFVKAYMYRFTDYLYGESQYLFMRLFSVQNWINTLPFIGFSLYALSQMFKAQRRVKHAILISFVIFSPLGLHLIAWDYNRIWMYIILHAFLVVWVLVEFYTVKITPQPADLLLFLITLLCMVLVPILPQAISRENLRILPLRLGIVVLTSAVLFAPLSALARQNTKASHLETPRMFHDPAQD